MTMTLDEAIKHCEEKAQCGTACGMEHKQLAEWLKELKIIRKKYIKLKKENENLKERNEFKKKVDNIMIGISNDYIKNIDTNEIW